jgi:shikimate dehydrogenase
MEKAFGIIGKKLSHSFSKRYFEKKFLDNNLKDHYYFNFELPNISDFPELVAKNKKLFGLNVTNPYKEAVIPFLDEISDEAKAIGAVNCIKIVGNKLSGYNTDVYGFSKSIAPFLDTKHTRALVLGTGGAAKAVAFALERTGVDVFFVTSAKSKKTERSFFYSELNHIVINAFKLIVNATPLGMFPDVETYPPIPYSLLGSEHFCYDLIYNPSETEFLKRSKEHGALTMNGLSMLHLQAEKSWEIWTN